MMLFCSVHASQIGAYIFLSEILCIFLEPVCYLIINNLKDFIFKNMILLEKNVQFE